MLPKRRSTSTGATTPHAAGSGSTAPVNGRGSAGNGRASSLTAALNGALLAPVAPPAALEKLTEIETPSCVAQGGAYPQRQTATPRRRSSKVIEPPRQSQSSSKPLGPPRPLPLQFPSSKIPPSPAKTGTSNKTLPKQPLSPGGTPLSPESLVDHLANAAQDNPHCTINTEVELGTGEIRTKVFRIGAPLLRSTIPVSLGRGPAPATLEAEAQHNQQQGQSERKRRNRRLRNARDSDDDEDVETVLSLSDVEVEDQGALSVTLDFPC